MSAPRFRSLRCFAVAVIFVTTPFVTAISTRADERDDNDDVAKLAAAIDRHIEARWKNETVTPTHRADDAELLRRLYLDLAGKTPAVSQVREYLADTSPDKRGKLVDKLLESPNYVTNFTNVWRSVMLPEVEADLQTRFLVPGFEAWLREKLAEDAPYDEMVREIVTLPLDNRQGGPPRVLEGGPSPIAFYQAKNVKPESLAAATARIFLGLRIECAQCHDHPFADWKREQFWSYAAFYAGLERDGDNGIFGRVREIADRRELAIPDTEMVVQAAFLDGKQPRWKFNVGARNALADWIVARDNPYFARAVANRLWAHFFGIGLVDPVDDLGPENAASHPELLDELADALIAHDFDLKFLIRAITASRAYQLSSRRTHPSQEDPRRFARMPVRGLSVEQLYNSLLQATGNFEPYNPRQGFSIGGNSPRAEFEALFANSSEPPTERSVSILQALAMMNGQLTAQETDMVKSRTLLAVAEYPGMDTPRRIGTLYLAALSRPPREDELERMVKYVEDRSTGGDTKQALGDVFWALLNSSEFLLNH